MKVLIFGGTGTISSAVVDCILNSTDWEIWMINRGKHPDRNSGNTRVHHITADRKDETIVREKTAGTFFDAVCDFIAFTPEEIRKDIRLFRNITNQFVFISSASAYLKPLPDWVITESTPLGNPFWEYSRNKILCEEILAEESRSSGFPYTIVRPSHTYGNNTIPVDVHGDNGFWQVLKRMMENKPVILHGDGLSLWTATHSSDFARGFVGLLGNPKAIGNIFHITNDEPLSWNRIYEIIASELGVELRPYHVASDFLIDAGCSKGYDFTGPLLGDKANTAIFDNSKLRAAVPDYRAEIPFTEGAHMAIQYILSHPAECQTEDPEFDRWCDSVIHAIEAAKHSVL